MLQNCDLLILDDLGVEFQTKFSLSVINSLINFRSARKLPTIISTNLSFEDIEELYGERLVSRFMEYEVLRFMGRDIRQLKNYTRRAGAYMNEAKYDKGRTT
jgi:DNA replication protein DnaC